MFVAAHTSAGKTVVAEYAIAMALRDSQRIVYTSPIKALSNQKYRDLVEEFTDVGLMTGDVTINPNASVLVMTTEILRSMLYRGSEIIRELAYVVFDEVHYMRDQERGVVWEESIILLPHKVRYVFLSATLPNCEQFTGWISKIHLQKCGSVYTEYRPTPLQHYMFPAGADGVHLIVDEKGKFSEINFQKAMSALGPSSNLQNDVLDGSARGKDAKKKRANRRGGKGGDILRLVKMCMDRHFDPVIVFSFSKRDCEAYATQMMKLNLNDDDEAALIQQVFKNAIEALSDEDKQLPQVTSILPLLKKGVGIHHGGLLPIIKEVVEILFGEGLLKVLFATETFAMGINMPAKTVVFTSLQKFDGKDFRNVKPGEYIQMSGRAGRRGLDDRGIVIQMVDQKMEPGESRNTMLGDAEPLNSTFHLGYNMVLNLLRIEDANPEFLIRNSFFYFQQECALPALRDQVIELDNQIEAAGDDEEDNEAVAEYHELCVEAQRTKQSLRNIVNAPENCVSFLQPGRLVRILDDNNGHDWGWGVVERVRKDRYRDEKREEKTRDVVETFLLCMPGENGKEPKVFLPGNRDSKDACRLIPVTLPLISEISSVRVRLPKGKRRDQQKTLKRNLLEVLKRFPGGPPLLDPIKDMNISSKDLSGVAKRTAALNARLENNAIHRMAEDEKGEKYAAFLHKHRLKEKKRLLEKDIAATQALPLKDTLRRMKAVLRRLGHTNQDNVVQLKGRVAAELSTCDELLLTELILGGVFNDLEPAVACALVSCAVFTEGKGEENIRLPNELTEPFKKLQDAAKRVAEVQYDAKIAIDKEEYVRKFKADMMQICYAWCKGSSFKEVCSLNETIFEGTIIRVMRRLEESMRQLCCAARVVGDTNLEIKFKAGIDLIKRDIIFAASLYL